MKCKLFLTFDHELPLGGLKTSYHEALFRPTKKLLEIATGLGVPLTLFTDVLCAYQFSDWDKNDFFQPYKDQLYQALHNNHDVQLHLHPHWLTSVFEGNTYQPSGDFMLSDFKVHPVWDIRKIVSHGRHFLTELCAGVQKDYRCVAYRAGGYNLEPGSDQIFQSLLENGICYDSSICKGYRFGSALSDVDFTGMPASPNWFIGPEGDFRKENNAGILEIPIAGILKTIFELPTRFKINKMAPRAPADHGCQVHRGKPAGMKKRIGQLCSSRMLSFDNYTLSAAYLMKILEYNLHKYRMYDEVMLCAIGHPKTMGDYSMRMFVDFVKKVQEKHPDQVQFVTYRQLYQESQGEMVFPKI
ncbi:MAG TPA: hypothetical protein PKW80_00895 [Bacteroidales bacterium]|nr:hypothetical protein [Bacteroidales bacterium]